MTRICFFLFAILSCITTKAGCNPNLDRDSVLQRVDELKALVDNKFWPTFNAPQYALEMNYYYASGLYMILIMEKFGIEFRDDLFERNFTLTELLDDKLRNIGAGQ